MPTTEKKLFKEEISAELIRILDYWIEHAVDNEYGGFIGEADVSGNAISRADKGGILNARILWSFANGYKVTKEKRYLQAAHRAYTYFTNHFIDNEYGGIFWSVDYKGNPKNTRKQIYNLAFGIYGLAEYYGITKNDEALQLAYQLFDLVEEHSRDKVNGGYHEAFSREWLHLDDMRLSEKDRNDPKTMNTHLHVIEAYACLQHFAPSAKVKKAVLDLLHIFDKKILNHHNFHLKLFFNEAWMSTSTAISYGHTIEASWLLYEAAVITKSESLITYWADLAIKMTNATLDGIQPDMSLIHEYDPATLHKEDFREWWVSAEAMVGFLNAYNITEEEKYFTVARNFWSYTKANLLDSKNGEWIWGVNADGTKMENGKMGFWKCPYHNSRACSFMILNPKSAAEIYCEKI
jgi:cellobiose epimerase